MLGQIEPWQLGSINTGQWDVRNIFSSNKLEDAAGPTSASEKMCYFSTPHFLKQEIT